MKVRYRCKDRSVARRRTTVGRLTLGNPTVSSSLAPFTAAWSPTIVSDSLINGPWSVAAFFGTNPEILIRAGEAVMWGIALTVLVSSAVELSHDIASWSKEREEEKSRDKEQGTNQSEEDAEEGPSEPEN